MNGISSTNSRRGEGKPTRVGWVRDQLARHITRSVAGYGRLRRPPSQPARLQAELGNSISIGSGEGPGNWVIEGRFSNF